MQILSKGKLFTTNNVWFENAGSIDIERMKCDKVYINANPVKLSRIGKYQCRAHKQMTLISDLSLPEDELRSVLGKTVRNEINRSRREGVGVKTYRSVEVNDALLDEFDTMYRKMYAEKGIRSTGLNKRELKAYRDNDALLVSAATIDNTPVVYHSYVFDSIHSRFLHSCSEFRSLDNDTRNSIGRANKYLHWNDWLVLKDMGVKEYDWGGIASYNDAERN